MSDEALEYLVGGGIPSAKFDQVGDVVRGRIKSLEKKQQTEFGTGTPLTFDNGDPMWQVVVTLETDDRDPDRDDDDGLRNLYVKAQMRQAVGEAIRKSGHKGQVVGGMLAVKRLPDGPPGRYPTGPRQYRAQFEPPAQTAAFDDYGDEEPF